MMPFGYVNTLLVSLLYIWNLFFLSPGSTTTWNQLCPVKAGKNNSLNSMRCCFTVILCVQLTTTVFSKLLQRQHFWTNCSNCCSIQEESFRADKLMEFYKVSSYIGVFIVLLYTKYCHVWACQPLNFKVIWLYHRFWLMIFCLVLFADIYLLLTLCAFWQSDMKLKKFLHIIENSPVYPVIYDSNR